MYSISVQRFIASGCENGRLLSVLVYDVVDVIWAHCYGLSVPKGLHLCIEGRGGILWRFFGFPSRSYDELFQYATAEQFGTAPCA
jgi:hypothetical protein